MDVLFLDKLEFNLAAYDYAPCRAAPSMEEMLRQSMAIAGLELIDYGSWTAQTRMPAAQAGGVIDMSSATVEFLVVSKAYRARAERAAQP